MNNELTTAIPPNDLKVRQTPLTRISLRLRRPSDSTPRAAVSEPSGALEPQLPTTGDVLLPRASSPRTSNIDSNDIPSQISTIADRRLSQASEPEEEDFATRGLEALAAAAAPVNPVDRSATIPSPVMFAESGVDEDMLLFSLFSAADETLASLVDGHVVDPEMRPCVLQSLQEVVDRANGLLKSRNIFMESDHIIIRFLSRLLPYEAARTKRKDFSTLLTATEFLPAVAVVLLRLPRLSSVGVPLLQAAATLNCTLFDVLLVIEPVVRMLPELLKLPGVNAELRALEQHLLECAVWQEAVPLYKLLANEDSIPKAASPVVSKLARPIYAAHKALESLTGFASSGSALTRLELFFRKFLRLASVRLQLATRALGSPPIVSQLAWEFFVELVGSEGHSIDGHRCQLFRRRHLNHILMAVLFSVARLSDQERTCAQIAACLPDSHYYWNKGEAEDGAEAELMHTWMNLRTGRISKVFAGNDEAFCDYYTFYNDIFLPPLQHRLLHITEIQDDAHQQQHKRPRRATAPGLWLPTERLFTSAPVPSPMPVRQLSDHVSIEMAPIDAHRRALSPTSSSSVQMFHYVDPIQREPPSPAPQNSCSTSYSSSAYYTEDEAPTSEPHTDTSNSLQHHQQLLRSPKSSLRAAIPHKT